MTTTEFPWEALATLITGILAVSAAAVVAVKQNNIVKRQVKLQELQFRNETFERRMGVYRTIRKFLWGLTHATEMEDQLWLDWEKYQEALQEARFLFSKRTYLELNALNFTLDETMTYLITLERDDLTQDSRALELELIHKRQSELRRQVRRFPTLFDGEMNLRDGEESYEQFLSEEQRAEVEETIADVAAASRRAGYKNGQKN